MPMETSTQGNTDMESLGAEDDMSGNLGLFTKVSLRMATNTEKEGGRRSK